MDLELVSSLSNSQFPLEAHISQIYPSNTNQYTQHHSLNLVALFFKLCFEIYAITPRLILKTIQFSFFKRQPILLIVWNIHLLKEDYKENGPKLSPLGKRGYAGQFTKSETFPQISLQYIQQVNYQICMYYHLILPVRGGFNQLISLRVRFGKTFKWPSPKGWPILTGVWRTCC